MTFLSIFITKAEARFSSQEKQNTLVISGIGLSFQKFWLSGKNHVVHNMFFSLLL